MPHILITPLNWGLGHATRCLPIAKAFEQHNQVQISWASDGDALALLKRERPQDTHYQLPSYNIRYPTRSGIVNMLLAAPRMLAAIQAERQRVETLHEKHCFDFILSDNRYGCRATSVANSILTHQVHLPVKGNLPNRVANALHHNLLGGFNEVVVPDFQSNNKALAGAMSRPLGRMATHYIGPLSRFEPIESDNTDPKHLLILLSGPEPARSKFESLLLDQLTELPTSFTLTIVRGTTQAPTSRFKQVLAKAKQHLAAINVFNLADASQLKHVLAEAGIILCRPGYTTVMDLVAMQKTAIYVPTPGQPEQDELGASLQRSQRGLNFKEKDFVLAEAIADYQANNFCFEASFPRQNLATWVSAVLQKIR